MTSYAVEITAATPHELTNEQLDELSTRADEQRDWTLSRRAGGPGWTVVVWVEADDVIGATQDAVAQVRAWSVDQLIAIHVRTEEAYSAAAHAPTLPELASATDAAQILGVARQRIHQLRAENPRFPAPVAEVALGPLWTRAAIEWFNTVWERKPGRPAGAVPRS